MWECIGIKCDRLRLVFPHCFDFTFVAKWIRRAAAHLTFEIIIDSISLLFLLYMFFSKSSFQRSALIWHCLHDESTNPTEWRTQNDLFINYKPLLYGRRRRRQMKNDDSKEKCLEEEKKLEFISLLDDWKTYKCWFCMPTYSSGCPIRASWKLCSCVWIVRYAANALLPFDRFSVAFFISLSFGCCGIWILISKFVANIFHRPSQSTFFGSNSNQCTGYTHRIGRMEAVCFVCRSCCRSAWKLGNVNYWKTHKMKTRERNTIFAAFFLFSAFSVESAVEIPHAMENEGKKELIFSRFGRFEMRKKNINIDCRFVYVYLCALCVPWGREIVFIRKLVWIYNMEASDAGNFGLISTSRGSQAHLNGFKSQKWFLIKIQLPPKFIWSDATFAVI